MCVGMERWACPRSTFLSQLYCHRTYSKASGWWACAQGGAMRPPSRVGPSLDILGTRLARLDCAPDRTIEDKVWVWGIDSAAGRLGLDHGGAGGDPRVYEPVSVQLPRVKKVMDVVPGGENLWIVLDESIE
jgi:hypothetical protein